MIYRWLLFIMFSMCVNNIFSQKIERVHGEYTYYVPKNISLDEGKRTALERAKIQALSDTFGTIVSQSNSTIVKSDNGKSDIDFLSLGGSDVKGEWIETVGEPKFNIFYDKGMLVVNVSVEGKARAITTSGIDLDVKVLRNSSLSYFISVPFRSTFTSRSIPDVVIALALPSTETLTTSIPL